ncbi:hypothetical protein TgHK011_007580 [Trichoderma gracile]|nr:hypothetical protein TgHK011_007580 [Trichoderma gracile]
MLYSLLLATLWGPPSCSPSPNPPPVSAQTRRYILSLEPGPIDHTPPLSEKGQRSCPAALPLQFTGLHATGAVALLNLLPPCHTTDRPPACACALHESRAPIGLEDRVEPLLSITKLIDPDGFWPWPCLSLLGFLPEQPPSPGEPTRIFPSATGQRQDLSHTYNVPRISPTHAAAV